MIVFSIVYGALSIVLRHLPELWADFKAIWADRVDQQGACGHAGLDRAGLALPQLLKAPNKHRRLRMTAARASKTVGPTDSDQRLQAPLLGAVTFEESR